MTSRDTSTATQGADPEAGTGHRPEGDMAVGSTGAALGGDAAPEHDMNGSQPASPAPHTGSGKVGDGPPHRSEESNSGTSATSIGGASGTAP